MDTGETARKIWQNVGVGWGLGLDRGRGLPVMDSHSIQMKKQYSDSRLVILIVLLHNCHKFILHSFSILVLSSWELVRCLISFSTSERESLLQKPCWNGRRKMFRVPVRKKVNVLEALKGHVLLPRVCIQYYLDVFKAICWDSFIVHMWTLNFYGKWNHI